MRVTIRFSETKDKALCEAIDNANDKTKAIKYLMHRGLYSSPINSNSKVVTLSLPVITENIIDDNESFTEKDLKRNLIKNVF